ncbi:MAG: lysophospholipid acyltransferase family protein [Cyclobacteriaceae bacterium]|nr:lysophospholipid acyltransferase family protein [Cyclobacteriaceae bacterium]UYN85157.1 MAG: lysophospholipid acyltransferase family protein [Cyclobacteriaceae bacterium]
MKWLCRFYLKLIGWRTGSTLDPSVKKCVLVAAPHTSNWDYPIALATLYASGVKVRFLAKDSLFKFPLGILMHATGGMPVDRSKHNNLVDALVHKFHQHEELILMIAVEGTRSYVKEWKSGFYHTAVGAGVPIAMGYLDYGKKVAGFGDLFYPTGDYQKDLLEIQNFYRKFTARHPEKSSLNQ